MRDSKTDGRIEFVYLLTWPDEATKDWKAIKRVTGAEHGISWGEIQDRTLTPTAYSPSAFARAR